MDPQFIANVIGARGEKGKRWLDNLPQILKFYARKWKLTIGQSFPLSYNYVVTVTIHNQTPAVLKIGFPGDKEFLSEIQVLEIFHGEHMVRMLEKDEKECVILLEKITPGIPLSQIKNDEESTRIACQLIKNTWKDVPQESAFLIPIQQWHSGYATFRTLHNGTSGPLPNMLFSECEALFTHLIQTTKHAKLLHGDFHHGNILSSEKHDWKLIDPKGIIGDPMYDLAVFLYNPLPALMGKPNLKQVLEKRIDIMSEELGFDKLRICQWAMAQSMLATIWSLEDNGEGWKYTFALAKLFKEIKEAFLIQE